MLTSNVRIGVACALGFALAGCGLQSEGTKVVREAVTGTVTVDGRPLDSATIVFLPSTDLSQDVTGARIVDGKFFIPRGEGPSVGSHKVRISQMLVEQGNIVVTSSGAAEASRETLPERYNTATVLMAEIRKGQPNELEFSLDGD